MRNDRLFFSLLGFMFFIVSCGQENIHQIQSDQSDSILDGLEIEDDRLWLRPSMIMFLDGNLKQYCSGTLVAKNVVLTAAHCLDSSNKEVYVSSAVKERDISVENTRPVSTRYIHPKFTGGGGKDDLALAVFRRDLPKSSTPFPLPKDASFTIETDLLLTVGYGKDKYGRKGVLKWGVLPPKITLPWISDGVIYALQTEGFGICFGDSGGPLIASVQGDERLVGVTSFVGRDRGCYGHSGFVQLKPHLPWLKKRIARLQEAVDQVTKK